MQLYTKDADQALKPCSLQQHNELQPTNKCENVSKPRKCQEQLSENIRISIRINTFTTIYLDFKLSLGFAQVLTWCHAKPMQLRTTDIDEAILFAIGNQIRGSKIHKEKQNNRKI